MKHWKKIIAFVSIITLAFVYPNIALADAIDSGANNHSGATGVGYGDAGNGMDYMCQGFVMSQYTQITSVGFNISAKSGTLTTGQKVWIDTTADLNSVPLGTKGVGIGGGTEITNAQLVTGALTKYTLTTAVNVTIGSKYVLCMAPWNTSTHVWTADFENIISSTVNPYANGRLTQGDTAYTTWIAPNAGADDMVFDIYGVTAVAAPQAMAQTVVSGNSQVNVSGNVIINAN